jgi:hypothetical protein
MLSEQNKKMPYVFQLKSMLKLEVKERKTCGVYE